jgi:hypothetical protein
MAVDDFPHETIGQSRARRWADYAPWIFAGLISAALGWKAGMGLRGCGHHYPARSEPRARINLARVFPRCAEGAGRRTGVLSRWSESEAPAEDSLDSLFCNRFAYLLRDRARNSLRNASTGIPT